MNPRGAPLVSYWKYIVFVLSVCDRITPFTTLIVSYVNINVNYHQRLGDRKRAIIAVSRKILCLIYYLLSTGQFYDNEVAMRPYLN
ncbi:hypothetical protein [uncultured Eubacterium sp.]|uniref:hypothetical protein n=1 Tax=uncultured Eubacterium sp. TaxID=165185 RepID=UPI0025D78E03|nr:hypothetical protein [uncultured Eubacterium sp.]